MDKLLPPHATSLERHLVTTIVGRQGAIDLAPVSQIFNPDTCPAHLLPWLAWAERVDEWSSLWSVPVQRAVITAQRAVRRKRGTKQAVVDAVRALSGAATLKEWWQHNPKKTPHTFDIVIAGGDGYVEAELQQSMIRAIERTKPARSHYTLGVGLTAKSRVYVTGVARIATYQRLQLQDR